MMLMTNVSNIDWVSNVGAKMNWFLMIIVINNKRWQELALNDSSSDNISIK